MMNVNISGTGSLVYAIGTLGTGFDSNASKDSFAKEMMGRTLAEHLAINPQSAHNLIWTLNIDETPIYAIIPQKSDATVTYEILRGIFTDSLVKRVSVPGYIGGSIELISGCRVPVLVPDVRGIYVWSPAAGIGNVKYFAEMSEEQRIRVENRLQEYSDTVYFNYRNLGLTPSERALNFVASQALTAVLMAEKEQAQPEVLEYITVEKSPISRPDSDSYDVKLTFTVPKNTSGSRLLYRYTVDVSEALPRAIGSVARSRLKS